MRLHVKKEEGLKGIMREWKKDVREVLKRMKMLREVKKE